MDKTYMCIDLKSFYASVECMERGLDPLTTNLVVADPDRTEKTICLAVSPSLKKYGIPGRARLFEVVSKVKSINYNRKKENKYHEFTGKSYNDIELNNKELMLDFIIATPQMKKYMKYSTDIYNVYLKYMSSSDIYVYSIDEVFCDITPYLKFNDLSPEKFAEKVIRDVYETTGITATAGIGTNMYLAKVAMDIVAKHAKPNEYGVRIAKLNELSYRKLLWNHRPLTDFWRTGPGIAKRLEEINIYTMGDLARASLIKEDLLFKIFGVNAELIIDHAWGYEPTTIEEVKMYKPRSNSISSGQVLHCAYDYEKTKLIIKEMADVLALDLVDKNIMTNQIVLTVGYDIDNLTDTIISKEYKGEITTDRYGRSVPKSAHGTYNLDYYTSSSKQIVNACVTLFNRIIDKRLLTRRINICACNVKSVLDIKDNMVHEQMDLFTDLNVYKDKIEDKNKEEEENRLQKTILDIKKKYGKNALLKGMNLLDGGTMIDRNNQVGGHRG